MTEKTEALRLVDVAFAARDGRWHTQADDELRRLDAECNDLAHQLNQSNERNGRLIAQRDSLLEALKRMEARFGCESSRAKTKPKTYGCRHMAETCDHCHGLVTGWMAIQSALATINDIEEK